MNKLHLSQVKAYHDAANQSIKKWALSFPLQPMEEGDSRENFVDRCGSAVHIPNWHVPNAKVIAINVVRKRAGGIYEKYHPNEKNSSEETAGDGSGETGDEIYEDVVGEDDGTDVTTQAKRAKNVYRNTKKQIGGNSNSAVRKKNTTVKSTYRHKGPANRAGRR